jgi:hypothetical protein
MPAPVTPAISAAYQESVEAVAAGEAPTIASCAAVNAAAAAFAPGSTGPVSA